MDFGSSTQKSLITASSIFGAMIGQLLSGYLVSIGLRVCRCVVLVFSSSFFIMCVRVSLWCATSLVILSSSHYPQGRFFRETQPSHHLGLANLFEWTRLGVFCRL